MCDLTLDLPSFLGGAKDVALAVAAVVTATIAYRGLQQWREELRGKADFEVARGLLRATFKLRETLKLARSRGMRLTFELGDTLSFQTENEARAHEYGKRLRMVGEALQEFDVQAVEAEALWGHEIAQNAEALRQCVTTFNVSVDAILDDLGEGGAHFESNKEWGRQMRANAHASPDEKNNPLSNAIAAAVGGIEARLRVHLERPK